MGYLLYSSNEMFSSTNLIRQSKQIFDKLQEKEIEKAVILRDGKPSFIMLDFEFYEKMMAEYSILKENSLKIKQTKKHTKKQILDQPIEQQIKQNKLAIENEMHIIQKDSDSVISHQSSDPLSVDLSQDFKDEHNGEIKEFWDK